MGSLRSSEIQLPSWKGREGHDAQLVCTRAPGAAWQPVSWSTAEADAVAPVSRARLSVLLPQSKHVSSEAVGPWWVTAVLVKGVVDRVAKTLLLAPARVWSHREGELLLPSVVLGDPLLQGPARACGVPGIVSRPHSCRPCRADPHRLGRDTRGHGHPAAWPAVQGWQLPPDSAARSESENPAAGSRRVLLKPGPHLPECLV